MCSLAENTYLVLEHFFSVELMTSSIKKRLHAYILFGIEMKIWDQHQGTCVKVVQKMGR